MKKNPRHSTECVETRHVYNTGGERIYLLVHTFVISGWLQKELITLLASVEGTRWLEEEWEAFLVHLFVF